LTDRKVKVILLSRLYKRVVWPQSFIYRAGSDIRAF